MKLLTLARDLRRRKARESRHLFVSEGVRAVEELLRSPLRVSGVLVTAQLGSTPRGELLLRELGERRVEVAEVSEVDFASAADTESPQGVLAIAEVPSATIEELARTDPKRVLLLDAVQDPGNVGTILRTAAALGVDATIALPGTVDPWNAKVVRGAMGAHYHHQVVQGSWEGLEPLLEGHRLAFWGADASGEPVDSIRAPERLALVVGNEGNGLTAASRDRLDRLVSLPIVSAVDSLNVAVATGILLYLLRR